MDERIAELLRALEEIEGALGGRSSPRQREALARGEWLAAAGVLAGAVAADLAVPLERVRGILAELVATVDGHVSASRGPRALPWPLVAELRQRLVDAFVELGHAARLAGDLAAAVVTRDGAPGEEVAPSLDVEPIVERAVALARGRLAGDRELFVDLGRPPRARGEGPPLTRALLQLLAAAAFASEPRGRVVVTTEHDARRDEVLVAVEHAPAIGGPLPRGARAVHAGPRLQALAAHAAATLGGRLLVTQPAPGLVRTELRLRAAAPALLGADGALQGAAAPAPASHPGGAPPVTATAAALPAGTGE